MLTFLLILLIAAAVLLVLIIMSQNPKGGGLSSSFGGGGSANNVMGVKQTTNFLEKTTWSMAIGIMAVVIFTNFFIPAPKQDGEGSKSRMENQIQNMDQLPQRMPQGQGRQGSQGQGARQQPQGGGQQGGSEGSGSQQPTQGNNGQEN